MPLLHPSLALFLLASCFFQPAAVSVRRVLSLRREVARRRSFRGTDEPIEGAKLVEQVEHEREIFQVGSTDNWAGLMREELKRRSIASAIGVTVIGDDGHRFGLELGNNQSLVVPPPTLSSFPLHVIQAIAREPEGREGRQDGRDNDRKRDGTDRKSVNQTEALKSVAENMVSANEANEDKSISESCLPTCRWQCMSQKCDQICKPQCRPPRCETRCSGVDTTSCRIDCSQPNCMVVCPSSGCSEVQPCASCKTECAQPVCTLACPGLQNCSNVCEHPQCDFTCDKPNFCPPPLCKMVCDTPRSCQTSFHDELPPKSDGETVLQSFSVDPNANAPVEPVGLVYGDIVECQGREGKVIGKGESGNITLEWLDDGSPSNPLSPADCIVMQRYGRTEAEQIPDSYGVKMLPPRYSQHQNLAMKVSERHAEQELKKPTLSQPVLRTLSHPEASSLLRAKKAVRSVSTEAIKVLDAGNAMMPVPIADAVEVPDEVIASPVVAAPIPTDAPKMS